MTELDFTGERVVPNKVNKFLWNEHLVRYISTKSILSGKNVLDVGCGVGYGSHYLATSGSKSVLGIDNSTTAISYAKTHFKSQNLEFREMDITDMKLEYKTFDAVIAFEVIEHLSEQEKFLLEIKRVLKNDGILFISSPNRESNPPGYENPFHIKEFNSSEFKNILKKYFENVNLINQSYMFGIIFSSPDCNEVNIDHSLLSSKNEQQYIIGICSDKPISKLKKLFPIFYNHEDYLKFVLGESNKKFEEIKKLVENKNYSEAIDYAFNQFNEEQHNPKWNYFVALSYQMLKEYEKAKKHYVIALEGGFDEFWIRYNRGTMFLELREIKNASVDLERASILNPSHSGVQIKLNELKAISDQNNLNSN